MPETMKLEPCPVPWCQCTTVQIEHSPAYSWVVRCLECGITSPRERTKEAAACSWNRRPAQQSEPVAVVREIETVTGDYLTDPGEPFYRIELGGYCADFGYREAAENFAAQINALVANPPHPLADHELTPTPVDDREPSDDEVEDDISAADEITRLRKHAEAMAIAADEMFNESRKHRNRLGGVFSGLTITAVAKALDAYRAEYPDGGEHG